MGNVLDFLFFFGPWALFAAVYCSIGGATYARSRLYFLRYTELNKSEAAWAGAIAGTFFWVTIPWFLVSAWMGLVDPQTRAAKKAAERVEQMQRDTVDAEHNAKLQKARALEDMALRARERLQGQDIPYTREEVLGLEDQESVIRRRDAETRRAEVEAEAQQAQLVRYRRGY